MRSVAAATAALLGLGPVASTAELAAAWNAQCAPGTALEVVIMNSPRPAVVLGEADYDPQNIRPRSDISTSAEPKGMTA